MPQWSFFVIALATVWLLAIASILGLLKILMMQNRTLTEQRKEIQTLTNLVASKDPMTFQQLQMTTSQLPQSADERIHPLNDEAIAHRLAEDFKRAGFDPNYAYAQDDTNFLDEFGLNG